MSLTLSRRMGLPCTHEKETKSYNTKFCICNVQSREVFGHLFDWGAVALVRDQPERTSGWRSQRRYGFSDEFEALWLVFTHCLALFLLGIDSHNHSSAVEFKKKQLHG